MKLSNRVVLVTGASKGIGAGIAIEAAREGADVIINYHSDRDGAQATLEQITKLGRKGMIAQGDVSQKDHVDKIVAAGITELGKIDVLAGERYGKVSTKRRATTPAARATQKPA